MHFPVAPLVTQIQSRDKQLFYIALDPSLILTDEEAANLTAIEDVVDGRLPHWNLGFRQQHASDSAGHHGHSSCQGLRRQIGIHD